MTIHERIFSLRRAAGLSQETLAERVGVSRQAIGKWESGASLPGLDNLQALAAALGVRCDDLLTGGAAAEKSPDSGEADAPLAEKTDTLTDAGLRALLDAYAAAQKQAARRQRLLLACFSAVLLALAGFGVFMGFQLRALGGRVDSVSRQMGSIDDHIDQRIGIIRSDIEESLREQERLVAGFDWQYGAEDGDAVPLTLTATPKNRREHTTAAFSVVPTGGAAITVPAGQSADGVFTARLAVPLTEEYESFSVLAAFTTDGETQTQELFREVDFYSSRRMTAKLALTDFRAEVLFPGTEGARLSLGGECSLFVQRALQENTAPPVSAVVALLVDGEEKARETLDLSRDFNAAEQAAGGEAQLSAADALAVTYLMSALTRWNCPCRARARCWKPPSPTARAKRSPSGKMSLEHEFFALPIKSM